MKRPKNAFYAMKDVTIDYAKRMIDFADECNIQYEYSADGWIRFYTRNPIKQIKMGYKIRKLYEDHPYMTMPVITLTANAEKAIAKKAM
mgnify:CR=1 FL=1